MSPVRSCMGCGERGAQEGLVRTTWRDGALRRDAGARAAGRGGYLHLRESCFEAFVARRGAVRSLRAAIPRLTREALVRELAAALSAGREG